VNLDSLKPALNEHPTVRHVSALQMIRMLHKVEKKAGVPHVKGRGFHGIKRRSITNQIQVSGNMEIVAQQVGVSAPVIRAHYLQQDLGPKAETVIKLDERRRRFTDGRAQLDRTGSDT
jgi:hypothetical protein